MRSHWFRRKGFRGRSRCRWSDPRAASDNVTHGSWIIIAVGLGALLVGTLAVPGGPVHHWLTCNVNSITDISGSAVNANTCTDALPVVSALTPDDGPVTTSTVFVVTGTNLPIYRDSSASTGADGGYDFPNFLLMSDADGTINGWGNNSLIHPGTWGITVLSSSSSQLTFSLIDPSEANAVPLEIFLSTAPITAGEAPSAGDGTTGAE